MVSNQVTYWNSFYQRYERFLCRMESKQRQCVDLDSDSGQVEKHLTAGRRALHADAEAPGLRKKLRLDHLKTFYYPCPIWKPILFR